VRRAAPALLVAALLGALPAGAAHAQQDPTIQEARRLFERGVRAFDRGRHDEALALFEESYRVRASQLVLYNIAVTERMLDRPLDSVRHFRQWQETDAGADPQQRVLVEREISQLLTRLAQLELRIEPPGAAVQFDREPIEERSQPIVTTPGTHVVRVEAVEYEPYEREVRLAEGERRSLAVRLRPIATFEAEPQVLAPPTGDEDDDDGGGVVRSPVFWTVIGVVVVAAAVTTTVLLVRGGGDPFANVDRRVEVLRFGP
jgi:hypothetical protein